MARARYTDYINISKFHLLDVTFSLPPVFIPLFGFRSSTLPQITLTYKQVKEGNYEFPRQGAVERAECSSVVLEQGVSFFNSDFWDWIRKAIIGDVESRNLLLIQFSNMNVGGASPKMTKNFQAVPGVSGLGGLGVFEDGVRLPAKAWLLYRCRPLSYKPGTDFDAMSGEISLATLELQPEEFEEISVGI